MKALLISGSRSLVSVPGAREWMLEELRKRLDGVSLIVSGNAVGPDLWAMSCGVAFERWHYHPSYLMRFDGHGLRLGPPVYWGDNGQTPLSRNIAMAKSFGDRFGVGMTYDGMRFFGSHGEGSVVGFIDPNSSTRGTAHTLKHAEKFGLKVERLIFG